MFRFFSLLCLWISFDLFGMIGLPLFNIQKQASQPFDFVKMHRKPDEFDFSGLYKFVQDNVIPVERRHLNDAFPVSFAIDSYICLNALNCVKDELLFYKYLTASKYYAQLVQYAIDLRRKPMKQYFVEENNIEQLDLKIIENLNVNFGDSVLEIINNVENKIIPFLSYLHSCSYWPELEKKAQFKRDLFWNMERSRCIADQLKQKEAEEEKKAKQALEQAKAEKQITSNRVRKVRFANFN